jgi:hypothetical protein
MLQDMGEAGEEEITYFQRGWEAQEGRKTTTTNDHDVHVILHAPSSTTTTAIYSH